MSLRDELVARRGRIVDQIRDIAPDLAAQLLEIDAALDGLAQRAPLSVLPAPSQTATVESRDDFGDLTSIEAIVKYLQILGKPCPSETIIQGLVANGFQSSSKRSWAIGNLRRSFAHWLKESREGETPIRQVGDLVGLSQWDDSTFHP